MCVKKLGRDAGDKAVVTKVIDKNFVMIMSHSRPKERKCNVKHLEFLNEKADVKNRASIDTLLELQPKKAHAAQAPAKKK